jgi:hypothetical protein
MELLRRSWRKLKRLHPIAIDLSRIALIREQRLEHLRDPERLRALILELGLNDDGIEEMPPELHEHCGQGLHIWQYPIQFDRYLIDLSRLGIESYIELGVRHGGTFVATVEYLDRFQRLKRAVGIDIMPCPSLVAYAAIHPAVCFRQLNTQADAFLEFLHAEEAFDLVLIDANHDEMECRREFEALRDKASVIVLHDVNNIDFPGVAKVWNEIRHLGDYECREYVEQYGDIGPHMGIGMAISRSRVNTVAAHD